MPEQKLLFPLPISTIDAVDQIHAIEAAIVEAFREAYRVRSTLDDAIEAENVAAGMSTPDAVALASRRVSKMIRGGLIQNLAASAIERDLGKHEQVEVCHKGFTKFYLGDRIVLRIKAMNGGRVVPRESESLPTQRYYSDAPMENVRSGQLRLTCGQVEEDGELTDVVVTYQLGDELVWGYSLLKSDFFGPGATPAEGSQSPPQVDILVDGEVDDGSAGSGVSVG